MTEIERSHYCGEVRESMIGQNVRLKGWARTRRDLGQVIFIDLGDHSGIVQTVFNPEISEKALTIADSIRSEYVLDVHGKVVLRDEETVNDKIATGTVEVQVEEITILNKSKPLPFPMDEDINVSEDVRLSHRFLDLRRPEMQRVFQLRHKITQEVREFLNEHAFMEAETPMLTKSTPEGARDYLVPSRVHEHEFFALPQSPQLFKQLFMIAGFERYYQIARCFRDEDLRADRQPEFTQIDIEASFMDKETLFSMTEEMMARLLKISHDIDVPTPFPRLTYHEAMHRYGSDKPDTRFGMELVELSDIVKNSRFQVFTKALESNGIVKGLNAKGQGDAMSRKEIDDLAEFAAIYGAKGLAWLRVESSDSLKGPIAKFLSEEEQRQVMKAMEAEQGDLLLFAADEATVVFDVLGALRLKFGKELGLIDEKAFHFLWVTDFPLVEYDKDIDRHIALHHPFTRPVDEDIDKLETAPEEVTANAYDLVLNGYELGGGSQRIHEPDLQMKMFRTLGFSEEKAKDQFGFLIDALSYGAPPHGGIALGLDRIVMLLAEADNLREVIAFPKTASAGDLLTGAPSSVSEEQWKELHLQPSQKKPVE
ncbi:aspartate--tRNA ligase [Salicibibacter halophilus]|uniref:Aspartate--tRNA ligase n=1 Tax=Salicibibacter halophilus TaxID=2502791 RepID=A0A514LM02_9BACI|nr:aspartate--tRNA ligase [Salicibibacter halophilus]QDI92833.1 aspartate--tRNA ligase [Salicibibacter halophilus]